MSCPGPTSEEAGKKDACKSCPNYNSCSTSDKTTDPAIAAIASRLTINHKILVLSGKGGVGKSTVSATLAHCLSSNPDVQVGLLDIDICGPSIPIILGIQNETVRQSNSGWIPVYVADNLAVMSIAFLIASQNDAVIWKGPKKNGLIKQFLRDVDWSDLDYLIVDTPPGTSDEHLSVIQYLSESGIDGAVLVTTPQDLSVQDVRRELDFCKKVGCKVIGIIENMSTFTCKKCGTESSVFPVGKLGGARGLAAEAGVPFLGSIPLDPRIGMTCDAGQSFIDLYSDTPAYHSYIDIVQSKTKFTLEIEAFCNKGGK